MIKWEHWPVRFDDDRIRIGGIVPGIAKDIHDPDGWAWALLAILDGTRTVGQVVAELAHRFPGKGAAEVRAGLDKLTEAGYIEDAAAPTPEELTVREQERYSRSRTLWRWMDQTARRSSWEPQLLLRKARAVVIGIGGVGTTAALSLAMSGVGELHCVEPDVVEVSNLNRQILFTERDVGRSKAEVAVTRLREYNSDITVTGEALTITGPASLARLAAEFDVVVLAADQPQEIRSWTNQACVQTETMWVHGGYHGPLVNVGVYRPGTQPCYDCAYTAERERRSGLPPRVPMPPPAERVFVPQASNAVSAGIAGQLSAHAAMSLITGIPGLRTNCEFGINLVTLEHNVILSLSEPMADCPTCAPQTRPDL